MPSDSYATEPMSTYDKRRDCLDRWHLGDPAAALDMSIEIKRLRNKLSFCGNIAAICRHELQGRLADDEPRRAFDALGLIQIEALGGNHE